MKICPEKIGDRILRSLAIGIAALSLLLPFNSYALGLGDIRLHSALNQPLDAEIGLLSADSINPDELKVDLASSDAFARADLDRPVYLSSMKFEIDKKPEGGLYIKVSSKDAIKEPFLDFLVEVNWPNGRLMREYTVLLDPPVLLNEKPSPVEAATETVSRPSQQLRPGPETSVENTTASTSVSRGPDQAAPLHSASGGLQYGPVTRTDTLWSIATRLRPDSSVTVHQVMMALLKNNPDAFYNNNINELKAGYVLRISDPDSINAMSAQEALRESRLQYQQWLDAKRNAGQAAGQRAVGTDASSSAPSATAGKQTGGQAQLKLVAPSSGESGSQTGAGFANVNAELESLREELNMALETSDVTRQENEELRNRISALEDQLASMQRLVTLKDDTMAAIQGSATQQQAAGGTPQTEQAGAAPLAEVEVPESAQQPVAPPPQPATPPKPAPPAAQPAGDSAITMLMRDPLTLGLGGLVVVIVLILIWMKVRQRQVASDGFEEGILAAADQVADESDSAIASAVSGYTAESALDAIETDSDEMDVLAEADVYLAYRRFDKAIELLNGALQNEPDRNDYKLKLMEVYAESKDVDGFVAQAEELYAAIGPQGGPVWDKVVQIGKKLTPDHPLFSSADDHSSIPGEPAAMIDDDIDDNLSTIFSDSPDTSDKIDIDEDPGKQGMDQDLSFEEKAEKLSGTNESATEDTVTTDPEDSVALFDADEQPASFAMTDDENQDIDDRSGSLAEPSDETALNQADDDLLSFDMDEQSETSLEDLPAETNEIRSEESARDETSEDKSNVINFEPGLAVASSLEDAQQSDVATTERASGTSAENMGNSIEFESGLSAALDSEDDNKDKANIDASVDTSRDDELRENALDFELDALNKDFDSDNDSNDDSSGNETISGTPSGESITDDVQELDLQAGKKSGDDDTSLDDDLEWLSNIDDEISLDDDSSGEMEDDNLISDGNEVDTKLDLAKAYIDMDDKESARGILTEVVGEGNAEQKREAEELIQQIG